MPTPAEIRSIKKEVSDPNCRLPAIFNAVGDHSRCTLFKALIKRQDLSVSDVAEILNVSVSAASQHLKIMGRAGLLAKKRKGAAIHYHIDTHDPIVADVVKIIKRELNN